MYKNVKVLFCLLVLLCFAGAAAVTGVGQDRQPPRPPKTKESFPKPGADPPGFFDGDGVTMERSMAVDRDVTIKFCVAQGDLKINGWRRNEVRVFIKHGRSFHMKPQEKSATSGQVNWLWIRNAVEGRPGPAAECIAGESIEIDAPVGASLDISGHEARTTVDSVKKVNVNLIGGAVVLRNIAGGINAQTGRGDMLIENSSGSISLAGYTGSIVIADVKAGQIGDVLKVRTNSGAITMQKVEHRQIQASSTSGSVLFDGSFLPGGIYNFRTSAGEIRLVIPPASSCTLTAAYGHGSFSSDIPHKVITENITPEAKIVVIKIGGGAATVNLTTSVGSIGIKKKLAEF